VVLTVLILLAAGSRTTRRRAISFPGPRRGSAGWDDRGRFRIEEGTR
jgi:hypothetical protein